MFKIISKYLLLVFILTWFTACNRKIAFVPEFDEFHKSPNGAYIELKLNGAQNQKVYMNGELLVVDSNKIIIKRFQNNSIPTTIQPIAKRDIINYKIILAANSKENYTGANVILPLTTLTHGFFLLLTLPANLIVLSSVNNNKDKEFTVDKKNIDYNTLRKFARYPQGLPPFVNLANIESFLINKEE